MRAHGAGEAAFLVAEQFRLDKPRRNGTAIDGDEGLAAPRTAFVDHLRRQLFAGTALAGQENAGFSGAPPLDQAKYLLHRDGIPYQGVNGRGKGCGTFRKAVAHAIHYKSPADRVRVIVTRDTR